MSADALANNLTSPARRYLWEVMIPNPPFGESTTLLLRCQTASIPERAVGKILIPFKQTAGVAYPGKLRYSHTMSMVFVEGEDREIFTSFYQWLDKVVNAKTGYGEANIKLDMYLHLINNDEAGTVALRTKIIGFYPERMGEVALDQSAEDEMKISIDISFDRWEYVA